MEETNLSNLLDNNSMHQILSNLPVKTLIKVKCISKSWESLTYHPYFIKLYRSKSHHQLFIMMYKDDSILVYIPKYEFQGDEAFYKLTIPWSEVVILKPINGLFCFVGILDDLSCTGTLVTTIPTYGFGFDPSTGKHKILCIWDISRFSRKVEHIVQVVTLWENKWSMIDELPPLSHLEKNCGDKFYKPPDVEVILAFDVGTEKFRVILIQDVIVSSYMNPEDRRRAEYLLELDGHIAVIDRLDKNVVVLRRSDDDYRLKTEVT
ncbi:hypothetical protein MKX01_028486 [Papaver californicum]|nr:hypothetical protein MKX01_028486 [Papaver californicum]